MGFWKRQISKILIGGALLTIATGALGVLKSEEARLKREIVGCERIIESKTRDGGIPEELKRIKEAIKQREQLQEQQEEVQVGEGELAELIENLKKWEFEFSEERKAKSYSFALVNLQAYKKKFDMGKEALVFFTRFSDEKAALWYNYRRRDILKDCKDFLEELNGFFPSGLFKGFYEEFYSADIPMFDETYEDLLYQVYHQVLRPLKWNIEDIQEIKKALIDISNETNDLIVKLTKSEELRKRLKEYTEKMNDLNSKTTEYLDKLDIILDYLQNTKDQLEKEMQRKGIKIRD